MNTRLLSRFVALCVSFALSTSAAPPDGKGPGGGGKGGGRGDEPTVDHRARQDGRIQLGTSGGGVVDLANGFC